MEEALAGLGQGRRVIKKAQARVLALAIQLFSFKVSAALLVSY